MKLFATCVLVLLAYSSGANAQTTTLLSHTFDGVIAPDLPAGVVAENTTWKTSISSASPGSGLNNLSHTGSAPAFVTMGPIDLSSSTEATLSYHARRTSSYPADSLIVRFSVDGGLTFPYLYATGGLPAVASTYEFVTISLATPLFGESDVYLQFDGHGGSTSSSNIRIDDVLITTPLNPGAVEASFGFSADSSTWNSASGNHFLSIDLSWPGPDSIQGFQFDFDYDETLLALSGVSTTHPILSGADWEINQHDGRVVVVSLTGASLPPGENPGLLRTEWIYVGPELVRDSTLTLDISSLLVAEASPLGDAIALPNGVRSHLLTIIANTSSIALDTDSLDFGPVSVGDSTSLSIQISNPTGASDLVIDSVRTSSGVFRLDSAVAPIAPGQSKVATFWFTPSLLQYGSLTGQAWIYHNAPSDSTLVSFSGVGVGGRGDADGDGSLDVADVVSALDVVSGLVTIGPSMVARYDLYPFPSGDGFIDVRDLTVQIQAILRAEWPDQSGPPVSPGGTPNAGKQGNDAVFVSRSGGELYLETEVALRGVQIEIRTPQEPRAIMASKSGVRSSSYFEQTSSAYRSLIVLERSSSLQPGRHFLLDHLPGDAILERALVVTEKQEKFVVSQMGGIHTAIDPLERPSESPFSVYPNPVSLSRTSEITILSPAGEGPGRIEVIDLLGRLVFSTNLEWSGTTKIKRDQLPTSPGILFFRMEIGSWIDTKPLLLVR